MVFLSRLEPDVVSTSENLKEEEEEAEKEDESEVLKGKKKYLWEFCWLVVGLV